MPRKRPDADYLTVFVAVKRGMLLKEALVALGVSQTGFHAWAKRTGNMKQRLPAVHVPWAVFKAVENEFRATPTLTDTLVLISIQK